MKKTLVAASLCCCLGVVSGVASAKGCLKGAAVGGIAGHVAGKHGVIGAAAGCAIGHHREKVKARNETTLAQARTTPASMAPASTPASTGARPQK